MIRLANEKIRISKSEWEDIGRRSGWIKEATFDEMFDQWSNTENKFKDLSTEKLRNLYLWSANDNQWLEQYEGGVDNGFNEEEYLNNLDEMLAELDRRKRLASNNSLIKEAGHRLPSSFKRLLNDLANKNLIRIERGRKGLQIFPNSIDPKTGNKFPKIYFHTSDNTGTLKNKMTDLRKACPSYTDWPQEYMQGAQCGSKKTNRNNGIVCDCCGSNHVTRDKDTSPTFIRCQEPNCGHVSFK